jgi:hypothetical protein
MDTMARFRGATQSKSAAAVICLALSLSQGCARTAPFHRTGTSTDASSVSGEQKLPFHQESDHGLAGDGVQPAVPPDPKTANGIPFRALSHPRIVPSGTLLTVRLESPLTERRVRAGDAFTASVAEPLTIDGDTLVERGAAVTGRVENAQSFVSRTGSSPDRGYFRLTLSAITVEDRRLALQTSNLFAKGTFTKSNVSYGSKASGQRADGVQLQKGRRLTFRLIAPVTLDELSPVATHQYLDSSEQ